MIREVGKSKKLQCGPAGWRPRRAAGAGEVWRQAAGGFRLAEGGWSFCSIQALDWLNETHPHYGGQSAYSEFTNLNGNLVPKHSPVDTN